MGGNENQQPPDERVICSIAKGCSREGSKSNSKVNKAPEEGLDNEEIESMTFFIVGDFPWVYVINPTEP